MARLAPLPVGAVPELNDVFEHYQKSGHYVPNSQLILQRKPKLVRALRALNAAVFDPQGEVTIGFMNRFNDTMATPLEEEPIHFAEKHIAKHGWKLGKHKAG